MMARDDDVNQEAEENQNEIANFDFEQWAKDSGLTRECTALLREEDLSKQVVLCMLTDTDIRGLGLSLGQTKLLQVAIRALHSQQSVCGETVESVGIQSDQPAVPTGATSGCKLLTCSNSNNSFRMQLDYLS